MFTSEERTMMFALRSKCYEAKIISKHFSRVIKVVDWGVMKQKVKSIFLLNASHSKQIQIKNLIRTPENGNVDQYL